MISRGLLVGALAVVTAAGCRNEPQAVFAELTQARRVAADLRIQMSKTADASNRAVLADTDEASVQYAREADHLKGFVKSDVADLEPRLRHLDDKAAMKALDDFGRQFAEYDKADQQVLALAVENTNLKAQRLSFGPAREAADAFRDSLKAVASASGANERCRVDELVANAVTSVLEIEVLWAPHIAEREDAVMTRLEKQMASLEAKAKPALAAAGAALGRFSGLSKEIIKLSRRNTNVISADLALRRMPALTAACDESLRVLGEALAKDRFPATR